MPFDKLGHLIKDFVVIVIFVFSGGGVSLWLNFTYLTQSCFRLLPIILISASDVVDRHLHLIPGFLFVRIHLFLVKVVVVCHQFSLLHYFDFEIFFVLHLFFLLKLKCSEMVLVELISFQLLILGFVFEDARILFHQILSQIKLFLMLLDFFG